MNSMSIQNDRFNEISTENQRRIKKILEEDPENNAKASSKAKRVYQYCIKNHDAKPNTEDEEMLSLIEKFGGWHMTGNFNASMTFTERVSKIFVL